MLLDNIYVINLDRSKKRLENVTKSLNEFNIKFKRFSAVDGKKLSEEIINNNASFLCRTLLCNHAIVGCGLSHMALWNQLVNDRNNSYYIILEDDVTIDDNF